MVDVGAMRRSVQGWRAGKRALSMDGFCTVETLPIVDWGGREYAVIRGPKLQVGPQKIEAIDLTEFEKGNDLTDPGRKTELPYLLAARFNWAWPEQGKFPTFEGETEEQILRRVRRNVLYIQPDEGGCALLCEDGDTRGCDPWTVGFTVRIIPGTRSDFERMQQEILDREGYELAYHALELDYLAGVPMEEALRRHFPESQNA